MRAVGLQREMMIAAALVVGFASPISDAQASTCEMLVYHLDEAETNLRRASRVDNLDDGIRYARRASIALDDAALAAVDCDCSLAYIEFETAAGKARRAKNASEPDEFVDELQRAIRAYNAALDAIQTCD